MTQELVNWLLGGFSALIGFLLNSVWQALKDLQHADKRLADDVAAINILVAGDYVRKDELNMAITALFAKLDRIEDKIDKKADKWTLKVSVVGGFFLRLDAELPRSFWFGLRKSQVASLLRLQP